MVRYAKEYPVPVKRRPPYSITAYYSLKKKIKLLGFQALDRRCPGVRALTDIQNNWLADMGGETEISGKQKTVLDAAALTLIYIKHLDSWLLDQRSLVRKRNVVGVLKERQALVDSLARLLNMLGLERKAKRIRSLDDLAKEIAGNGNGHDQGAASDGLTDVSADAEGDPQP